MSGGEGVFRLLLLGLLAAFVAHRGYHSRTRARAESDTLTRRIPDRPRRIAAVFTGLALLASAVYVVNPSLLSRTALLLPAWLRWAGVTWAVAGFVLLQWAHAALAQNWSDVPRLLQGQTLTRTGPYRWARHPIYSAFLIILSAPLLITANWLVGVTWIVGTAVEVAGRVRYEDALLAESFGDDYRDYARHTGRLLPRLRRETAAYRAGD